MYDSVHPYETEPSWISVQYERVPVPPGREEKALEKRRPPLYFGSFQAESGTPSTDFTPTMSFQRLGPKSHGRLSSIYISDVNLAGVHMVHDR